MRDFNQAYVSVGLPFFKEGFMNRWGFKEYNDPNKPAVFFGLYTPEDINTFCNHKSYKILVWGGNDMHPPQFNLVKNHIKQGHTFTFAPSGEFDISLNKENIPHKVCYIPNKDYSSFTPTPLGENIYVYKGIHGNRPDYFKWDEIIKPLQYVFGKDRIISTEFTSIEELKRDYYENCFVYVKPNNKGGCTTMYELAHMGIRTIGKGHPSLPFFTEYKDLNHLIDLILEESQYIGKIREDISTETKKLFLGNEWLTLDFWKL